MRRVARDIKGRLQAEARPHRWDMRCARIVRRQVSCRPDIAVGIRSGETDGVADLPAQDFLIAHQARQDRQTRRVRGGPGVRAQGVRVQVPDRAGAGVPAPARITRIVELIQGAGAAVHDQDVMVTAVLDPGIAGDRIGPRVRFIQIIKGDGHLGRPRADDVIRNPDRAAIPRAGAKIHVKACVPPDRIDPLVRARVNWKGIDRGIPDIIRGEHRTAANRPQHCNRLT